MANDKDSDQPGETGGTKSDAAAGPAARKSASNKSAARKATSKSTAGKSGKATAGAGSRKSTARKTGPKSGATRSGATKSGAAAGGTASGAAAGGTAASGATRRSVESDDVRTTQGDDRTISKRGEELVWRLIAMVAFGFVGVFALYLLFVAAAVQYLVVVLRGRPHDEVQRGLGWLHGYLRQILAYLCFETDTMPWPLSDLPEVITPKGDG